MLCRYVINNKYLFYNYIDVSNGTSATGKINSQKMHRDGSDGKSEFRHASCMDKSARLAGSIYSIYASVIDLYSRGGVQYLRYVIRSSMKRGSC